MENLNWNSLQDGEQDIVNQLLGLDVEEEIVSIQEKKPINASTKYIIKGDDLEAFNKRHEDVAQIIHKGDDKDAPEARDEKDFNDNIKANGCRPWVGAIKAPTWYQKDPSLSQKPKVKIELEYLHGYRSKDCRNNVKYMKNGEFIYNAAGTAVVMNVQTNTQRFFIKHTDDVTAIAINKEQSLVATGQVSDTSKNCSIYIWNPQTLEVIKEIKNGESKGCQSLSFSPDGTKLVSVSINDSHDINVFNVQTGAKIKSASGGKAKILACKWLDNNIIVTAGGERNLRVWNLAENLSFKQCVYGQNKCSKCVYSLAINPTNKDILVGAADGTVQIFKYNTCMNSLQLHEKRSVDALNFSEGYILTGGSDRKINILDAKTYKLIQKIDASEKLKSSVCPKIRSLQFSPDHTSLFVSTFGSEIYQLKLNPNREVESSKQLLAGHYSPNGTWTNEVWGLDLINSNPDEFVTVSDDSTIRVWSISKHKQLKAGNLNVNEKGEQQPRDIKNQNDYMDSSKARAVASDPKGQGFLVGFKDGTLRFLDSNLKVQKVFKNAKEWISAIKFSPNGNLVAVGSHDNAIYIYSYPGFKPLYRLNKHTSFITHIDFTQDGRYLRSVCGAYDLLFWDVDQGKQLTGGASALRDEEWATHSCIFSWPVQKMWKKSYNDYTDINFCDRSHSKINGNYILANGDDYSTVNLYKWPCVNSNAQWIEAKGHCSHITNVRFSLDDKHLITTGGEDNSVLIWKITSQ